MHANTKIITLDFEKIDQVILKDVVFVDSDFRFFLASLTKESVLVLVVSLVFWFEIDFIFILVT